MTPCRYPPAPYDWNEAMRLHEDRLDDHLTDEEVAERRAALERMAVREDGLRTSARISRIWAGTDNVEAVISHAPSLGNMLIPFFVLFAFAVGGLLAYLI